MAKSKSKKRRRSSSSGAETQQRRQERLEARRQAKAEALEAQQRAERRSRLIRALIVGALAAAIVWFFFLRAPSTPESIAGNAIISADDSGLNTHQSGSIQYDTRPPVAGPHSASLAPCGTYADTVPDERYVHSLEHGAVGILYQPDLDPADIEAIESLARRYDDKILTEPYTDMPSEITVTSWGEMMRLDSFDADAIRRYIGVFRGKGPEPNAECPGTVDESFQPPEDGN